MSTRLLAPASSTYLMVGEGSGDASVVLDLALFHGNVEVHAHDDALAGQFDIFYGFYHSYCSLNETPTQEGSASVSFLFPGNPYFLESM